MSRALSGSAAGDELERPADATAVRIKPNIEHRTSNIQRRSGRRGASGLGWMFDVTCSMFNVRSLLFVGLDITQFHRLIQRRHFVARGNKFLPDIAFVT